MKRFILLGVLAATVAALAVPFAHAALAEPDVPADIAVPDGNKLFLVGHASGVQIYKCAPTATGGYGWSFVAPRADLYGDNGKLVATHYAGPTWEATDGSRVIGQVEKRVTVDPLSIPWLRLKQASASAGADGDRLADATYIQRINTVGGTAPAAGCDADHLGAVEEVPYLADYYFYKALDA